MRQKNLFQTVLLLSLAALLIIFAWGWLFSPIASSQQETARIRALETDIYRIESRLNRIEALLSKSQGFTQQKVPIPPPDNRDNQPPLTRDLTFERLANLVIETRLQLKELEARVAKLEAAKAPSPNR